MSWEPYWNLIAVIPPLLTSIIAVLASIPLISGKYKSLDEMWQMLKSSPEKGKELKKNLFWASLIHSLMFLGLALGILCLNEKSFFLAILFFVIGIIGAIFFFSQLKKFTSIYE